jgi:hypothetical protein
MDDVSNEQRDSDRRENERRDDLGPVAAPHLGLFLPEERREADRREAERRERDER